MVCEDTLQELCVMFLHADNGGLRQTVLPMENQHPDTHTRPHMQMHRDMPAVTVVKPKHSVARYLKYLWSVWLTLPLHADPSVSCFAHMCFCSTSINIIISVYAFNFPGVSIQFHIETWKGHSVWNPSKKMGLMTNKDRLWLAVSSEIQISLKSHILKSHGGNKCITRVRFPAGSFRSDTTRHIHAEIKAQVVWMSEEFSCTFSILVVGWLFTA